MTNHKRFKLGFGHEIWLSHDPEDGSISAALHRGCDTLARVTGYGPKAMLGAGVELCPHGAGEEPIRLHLHALLFRLYLSLGGGVAEAVAARIAGRSELQVGFDACTVEGGDGDDIMITGAWFADRWSGKRGDPRFVLLLRDRLLGRMTVNETCVDTQLREVPLPEGIYEVRFHRYVRETRRARWPFAKRGFTVHATVVRGPDGRTSIPIPGKGESAHDCGDDGWSAMGLSAETIDEAIGELVGDVLERRSRYGGKTWRPEPPTPASAAPEDPPPAAAA